MEKHELLRWLQQLIVFFGELLHWVTTYRQSNVCTNRCRLAVRDVKACCLQAAGGIVSSQVLDSSGSSSGRGAVYRLIERVSSQVCKTLAAPADAAVSSSRRGSQPCGCYPVDIAILLLFRLVVDTYNVVWSSAIDYAHAPCRSFRD